MRILLFALAVSAGFQTPQAPPPAATPAPYHWHDDYTEYHLLAPDTNQFHIVYFLNQRQAGLTYVLNQTRSGSAGSDISVSDPRTGQPLKHDYMTGKELTEAGVAGRLNAEEHYIRAHLPRAVPPGGEGRVRIEKTYKDEKSYFAAGETITFARSLGIGRNAIVLPAGYSLVSSNVAAQIATLADGRVQLSFENINGYASDVSIRASRRAGTAAPSVRVPGSRAADSTKALYELQPDGSVRVTRDLFIRELGGRLNLENFDQIAGASVFDMDIGVALEIERDRNHVTAKPASPIRDLGGNAHLRVTGTLRGPSGGWTSSESSGLSWRHDIHEPRATIVLPAGYQLASSGAPATVGTLPDGRQYLQFVNNRYEALQILLRANK